MSDILTCGHRRFMACPEPYDTEALALLCLDCGEVFDLYGPGEAEDEAAAFGHGAPVEARCSLDPAKERAECLREEAETAGWSAGALHEESVRRGPGCGAPPAERCRRAGWLLTDFDTWVRCPAHPSGYRHPEDYPPQPAP